MEDGAPQKLMIDDAVLTRLCWVLFSFLLARCAVCCVPKEPKTKETSLDKERVLVATNIIYNKWFLRFEYACY